MAIELGVSSIPVSEVSYCVYVGTKASGLTRLPKVLLRRTLQDWRGLCPLRLLQGC